MKILLISDQYADSRHSAVEGLFGKALRKRADVSIAYFSRDLRSIEFRNGNFFIPRSARRRGLMQGLTRVRDLHSYDCIVVRNLFGPLRQVLGQRGRYGYKVGFWESFPHSYRRIHEARVTRRALLRKTLEYGYRRLRERSLVERCDFYLPITTTFRDIFRPGIGIPCHPLPLGIDSESFSPHAGKPDDADAPKRFIYVGTIDRLRGMDMVLEAFTELEERFTLDIYPARNNRWVDDIRKVNDRRIKVHDPLPRDELIRKIAGADVALGVVPETTLYYVSSPTKTLEYYALGIPSILNHIPEYDLLFDDGCAFFCDFEKEDIKQAILESLATPGEKLLEMGRAGRRKVMENRDYRKLADGLLAFLQRFETPDPADVTTPRPPAPGS